jgi:hypothetical protein
VFYFLMSTFAAKGGGVGSTGGHGTGGVGLNVLDIDVLGDQTNSAADGSGAAEPGEGGE